MGILDLVLKIVKQLFTETPQSEKHLPEYELWYNADEELWTAQFRDDSGNQLGNAGFGNTQSDAVNDLFYINVDILDRHID